MDSSSVSNDGVSGFKDKESMVDPFLVEALHNPRHRLTRLCIGYLSYIIFLLYIMTFFLFIVHYFVPQVLRMELDIQRFLNNTDQQHFEFQHFPSSYLRLAAHRVAQHYGMQTMVQDNGLDGQGTRILVRKLAESRYPVVRLSEIPVKHSDNDKPEQIKIAIKPRPNKTSLNEANEAGTKSNPLRSVEERKEEYDRARARIFSSSRSCDSSDSLSQVSMDEKISFMSKDENETSKNPMADSEKCTSGRDISSTRVAIFRDREKDRSDPDYDRSYGRSVLSLYPIACFRAVLALNGKAANIWVLGLFAVLYARSIPTSSLNMMPFSLQQGQPPFAQYDTAFNQLSQMSQNQASLGYGPPSRPIMSPFGFTGLNQTSRDAAYLEWPSAAMMYAHSYEQFRHAVFQVCGLVVLVI
ncbi:SUZ domain [Sesbania bispinosa]|nr:SUZ domain [Sesbania bispinosa]